MANTTIIVSKLYLVWLYYFRSFELPGLWADLAEPDHALLPDPGALHSALAAHGLLAVHAEQVLLPAHRMRGRHYSVTWPSCSPFRAGSSACTQYERPSLFSNVAFLQSMQSRIFCLNNKMRGRHYLVTWPSCSPCRAGSCSPCRAGSSACTHNERSSLFCHMAADQTRSHNWTQDFLWKCLLYQIGSEMICYENVCPS